MRSRPAIDELSEALSLIERCYLSQKRAAEVIDQLAKEVETVFIENGELIASNVRELSRISKELEEFTKQLSPLLKSLSDNAEDIFGLSKNIEQIKDYLLQIEKVASDTELISINASIEAARAGEYGKSFAVVANEIKEMSKFTFKILREIKSISDEVEKRVSVLRETVKMVQEIQENSEKLFKGIAKLMEISNRLSKVYEEQKKASEDVRGLSGIALSTPRKGEGRNR